MAIVRITLSQGVVDQQRAMGAMDPVTGADVGSLIDFFTGTVAGIEENYAQFSSWNMLGGSLRTTYADGAVGLYTGLALDNPLAARGRASVTGFDFSKPGLVELAVTGKMSYDYDMSGGALVFDPAPEGMTIDGLRVKTLLPTTSPDYDPILGNLAISMSGAITMVPSGEVWGSVSRVDIAADKFIRSASVEGDFLLGQTALGGQAVPAFEGTLKSFSTVFQDGSLISVGNAAITVRNGEAIEQAILRGTDGKDDISIDLPATLYEDMVVAAGAGDDTIALKGGGGRLRLAAGDGNDVVSLLGDRQMVDGGHGTDTVVLAGVQADYVIDRLPQPVNPDPRYPSVAQFTVTDKSGAISSLLNVERIAFANGTLALDVDGNAGQAYRLYQAAFDRTPDAGGLSFWINSLDRGVSLTEVAAAFLTQKEFKDTYGSSQSNLELVTRFYQNILGREPEAAGRDFWVNVLDTKKSDVAGVLAAISESVENKAGLVDIIGNGFTYTPWGGG